MSRQINVILALRDQFTAPIRRATEETSNARREVSRFYNSVNHLSNGARRQMVGIATDMGKVAAAGASLIGGLAARTGLAEAMDLQGYRAQLETATKSTKVAGEKMRWATNFANITPFETGEVVEATAALEMMGMKAERILPSIADMAGSTNKSMQQAVEALVDASTGEFERLKEFSIRKDQIIAESAKKYGKDVVFSSKGQMLDQQKMMTVLVEMMNSRFKGGAEKLSKTSRGMWSTVTGITKSGLAIIAGMSASGSIVKGTAIDVMNNSLAELAGWLTKLQQDGSFEKWQTSTASAVKSGIGLLKELYVNIKPILFGAMGVFQFIGTNWPTIVPIILTIVGAMGLYKGAMIAQKVITWATAEAALAYDAILLGKAAKLGLASAATVFYTSVLGGQNILVAAATTAQWAWNAALAANPIGFVVAGIAALIVGVILLVKNWDYVKKKAVELGSFIMGILKPITDFIYGISKGIGSLFGKPIKIKYSQQGIDLPKHAMGTPYFRGGMTYAHERGGEIMNLPGGTQIIPADKSEKMLQGGGGRPIVIQITGPVYGDDAFIDRLMTRVVRQLELATGNL